MELTNYFIQGSETKQCIIGQANFSLKTINDLVRAVVESAPNARIGAAMNDGSSKITRTSGNDFILEKEAGSHARSIGGGHVFIILVENAFPINFLNEVKTVPCVCNVFCATANSIQVLIAKTGQGNAVLGVVDGFNPEKTESEDDKKERARILKSIGYELG